MAEAQKKVDTIRLYIASVLSKARLPKQNINNEDRSIIKNLAKDKDILILPADKGKAVVLMDKSEYNSKLLAMVENHGE